MKHRKQKKYKMKRKKWINNISDGKIEYVNDIFEMTWIKKNEKWI